MYYYIYIPLSFLVLNCAFSNWKCTVLCSLSWSLSLTSLKYVWFNASSTFILESTSNVNNFDNKSNPSSDVPGNNPFKLRDFFGGKLYKYLRAFSSVIFNISKSVGLPIISNITITKQS